MWRRKPPVEAKIGDEDMARFAELAVKQKTTPQVLLREIIHDWIEQESLAAKMTPCRVTLLPRSVAVLFEGESLEEYSARVRACVIESVVKVEGNRTRAAKRLGVDRSSLYKIIRRLSVRKGRSEKTLVGTILSVNRANRARHSMPSFSSRSQTLEQNESS